MEQAKRDTSTAATTDIAGKLAEATQAMADALHNINAQFESLHAKIDRIVAAVDEDALPDSEGRTTRSLREKLANAEKTNHDLKAQAERARRKTLSPLVTTLLAKEGVEGDALIESSGAGESVEWVEHRAADCGEGGDGEGGDLGVATSNW